MLVKINFEVSAWVKELVIDADSSADALNKLNAMTLADIIEAGAIVDSDISIRDAHTEVLERNLAVRAFNIEYDFSGRNMDPAVVDYLKARLPNEQYVTLRGVSVKDDIEELLKDEITMITDYDIRSLEYQVLEEK